MEAGLQELLGQQLAAMQESLIEDGATTILNWFCPDEQGEVSWPVGAGVNMYPDVSTAAVELHAQPCMGVAGKNEEAVEPRMYQATERSMAQHVAHQALHSLRGQDEALERAAIAPWAYNASDSSRCCDTVLFAVHPVFGVFYKAKLPLVDRHALDLGDASDTPVTIRTACFRRRWIPKPVVQPLTYKSSIDHLFHPGKLPGGADAAKGRALQSDAAVLGAAEHAAAPESVAPAVPLPPMLPRRADNEAGAGDAAPAFGSRSIVHFILPFRARNLRSLPSLLRTLGVANLPSRYSVDAMEGQGAEAPAKGDHSTDFARLIIVPIEEDMEFLGKDFPVMQRVRDAVEAATPQVHFNISIVPNLPPAAGTKTALLAHLGGHLKPYRAKLDKAFKEWLAANKAATGASEKERVKEEEAAAEAAGKEAAANPGAGGEDASTWTPPAQDTMGVLQDSSVHPLLPNAWLRAVVAGLTAVPAMSSTVFVLDSSTSAVAPSLARKTLWRVIEGRQVYAPVPYALEMDEYATDDALGFLMRDGGIADVELPEGETPAFKDPHFYKWADPTQNGKSVSDDPAPAPGARRLGSTLRGESTFKTRSGLQNDDGSYGFGSRSFFNSGATAGPPSAASSKAASQASDDGDDMLQGHTGLSLHHGEDDALMPLPESHPLWQRMTSLGVVKADLVGAIMRVLKHVPQAAAPPAKDGKAQRRLKDETTPEKGGGDKATKQAEAVPEVGDQCVMRRILLELKKRRYTIARAVTGGFRVAPVDMLYGSGTSSTSIAMQPVELGPCECTTAPHLPHCELTLPLTSVDDTADKHRVNCAVSQMMDALKEKAAEDAAKAAAPGAQPAALGGGDGLEQEAPVFYDVVHVDHPVRYFEPHWGVKIVAKVASLDAVQKAKEGSSIATAEAFAFDWYVTEAAVPYKPPSTSTM